MTERRAQPDMKICMTDMALMLLHENSQSKWSVSLNSSSYKQIIMHELTMQISAGNSVENSKNIRI